MFKLISGIALCFFLIYQSIANATDVTIPEIDLSRYGKTIIVGDFFGVSLYAYNKRGRSVASSDAYNNELFIQISNEIYTSLGIIDGIVNVMTTVKNEGNLYIAIAGQFSSIGGVKTGSIVFYDLTKSIFVTLGKGIPNAIIKSLYFDETNKYLYIGGSFRWGNSYNVIIWDLIKNAWLELPFRGFDGVVNSIIQVNKQNILFGGSFDNTVSYLKESFSTLSDCKKQVLNLQTAFVSSKHSSFDKKYSNPRNVICSNAYTNKLSWILQDSHVGKWSAVFNYVFKPRKIRFKNSDVPDYGTRIFRLISMPINGIMNLSYIDPVTGKRTFCEASCPLLQTSSEYQEFEFVNIIPMTGVQLELLSWYGKGAGLKEVEILLNDIITYAVNAFNEPLCVNRELRSNSYVTGGPWGIVTANGETYLSANLSGEALKHSSVVFEPRIQNGGYYYVELLTPGCIPDNTCLFRGKVTIEIYYKENTKPATATVYQTQYYGKIDTIYKGYMYPISASFRPCVILTPAKGQSDFLNVVALSVRFIPISLFSSINGLYEYNPSNYSSQTSNEQSTSGSAIDFSRTLLSQNAIISSIIYYSSQTIIAGSFFDIKNASFSNILQITPQVSSLAYGGVNGEIFTMLLHDNILYIGGKFNKLIHSSSGAINNVASYSILTNSWISLLWGLNGVVYNIFKYNASVKGKFKVYIAFSGNFTQVLTFQNQKLFDVYGFALWDPDDKKWVTNIDLFIYGRISDSILTLNNTSLILGNVKTLHSLATFGAVCLHFSKITHSLSPLMFPKTVLPFFNSLSKRDTNSVSNIRNLIYTGTFYNSLSHSLTILGGRFIIKNNKDELIKHIAIIEDSEITGINLDLDPSSIILSVLVYKNILYAGGYFRGKSGNENINGMFMYDLKKKKILHHLFQFNAKGEDQIRFLSMRPKSNELIVAGKFEISEPLLCNSFCIFETLSRKWKSLPSGFSGQITSIFWFNENSLILSGDINLNETMLNLVKYHFNTLTWTRVLPEGVSLPGPAFSILVNKNDRNSMYFAGKKKNGHAYFNKWNGSTLLQLDSELLPGSIITHLRIIPLKRKHHRNNIVPEDIVILVLGSLVFSSFGNITGAFYDGNGWIPYLISSTSSGQSGIASSIFFEHDTYLLSRKYLAKGYVVLISLSISLSIIFLMTLCKIIFSKYQRKKGSQTPYFSKEKKNQETPSTGISNESCGEKI
ncbi:hypothetical protein PCK1_000023 [Pneumocystis canis]|nr:hypothetical protein PCK1_000023 [Pneumocystis canis]